MVIEYQNQQASQQQQDKYKLQYTANVDPKEKEQQAFSMAQNDYYHQAKESDNDDERQHQ
jgi:hypothetical protein